MVLPDSHLSVYFTLAHLCLVRQILEDLYLNSMYIRVQRFKKKTVSYAVPHLAVRVGPQELKSSFKR